MPRPLRKVLEELEKAGDGAGATSGDSRSITDFTVVNPVAVNNNGDEKMISEEVVETVKPIAEETHDSEEDLDENGMVSSFNLMQ